MTSDVVDCFKPAGQLFVVQTSMYHLSSTGRGVKPSGPSDMVKYASEDRRSSCLRVAGHLSELSPALALGVRDWN